jgi:succinyl-diaminopimelate desuccinylase
MADVARARAAYLAELDRRSEQTLRICSELIKRPSENPPGDTRAAADYVASLLADHGIPFEVIEPAPGNRSIVAAHRFSDNGPRLLLNGHLDTFHVEDGKLWEFDPFCGEIRDGKILGRGASDMKGGLTGSIAAFLAAVDSKLPLAGELVFMAVADEEDGGHDGTGWILDNRPEFIPDAALIGEPNSLDIVSIANKGIIVLKLTVPGEPMHGSIAMGDTAVTTAAEVVLLLRKVLELEGDTPEPMKAVLEQQNRHIEASGDQYYEGRTALTTHPSYNPAKIRAGVRHNVVPHECIITVDMRLPLGMGHGDMKTIVEKLLRDNGYRDVKVEYGEENFNFDPHYTDPRTDFAQLVKRNVTEVTGHEPVFQITYPGGDIRFIRFRGIPGIIFGPRPFAVGGFNEFVRTNDVLVTAKVHALTLFDFLSGPRKSR